MKDHLTIAILSDGKSRLIHGPEVPFPVQHKTVQGFRDTDVPEGVERVEIWTRGLPGKIAFKKTPGALQAIADRKALDAKLAEDAARAAAAAQGK